jgi:hypothetical protein
MKGYEQLDNIHVVMAQHSHRTAQRGSLPVNSSVPTSEAISILGDSMVEKRDEEEEVPTLRVSCTDLAE